MSRSPTPDPPTPPGLSRRVTLLVAAACGLAVACVYAAQPLLDEIAGDLGIGRGTVGVVVTVTQLAYGSALLLVVPLADVVDRRRLVVVQATVLAGGAVAAGLATGAPMLLAALVVVGFSAVLTQVLVALTASLTGPEDRGRALGVVTSGVVVGILLSRTVAGALASVAGWRAVYLCAALLAAGVALALLRALPTDRRPERTARYGALLASVLRLLAREPLLRSRAALAFLTFASFSTLWTSLALPLTDRPSPLSPAEIGLFGLAGAAGAIAAARAGRWADRGHGQRTTGVALAVLAVSWLPIGLVDRSLWWLILGLLLLDAAVQAVHVSNQAALYAIGSDAHGRLTAAYMVFYSLGSATGAIASTALYAQRGWTGVCLLGAAFSLAGLGCWAATRRLVGSGS